MGVRRRFKFWSFSPEEKRHLEASIFLLCAATSVQIFGTFESAISRNPDAASDFSDMNTFHLELLERVHVQNVGRPIHWHDSIAVLGFISAKEIGRKNTVR